MSKWFKQLLAPNKRIQRMLEMEALGIRIVPKTSCFWTGRGGWELQLISKEALQLMLKKAEGCNNINIS